MMEIIEKLIPKGKDRPGKLKQFIGVCIHDTGNEKKGANAKAHAKYETENKDAIENYVSYHYVIDDKECYLLVPEDERTWHAGDGGKGRGNNQTIAIEICVNEDGNLKQTTDKAAELAADILRRHDVDKEDIRKYLFQHHDFASSKKDCPKQLRHGNPYDWNTFVEKVISNF